MKKRIVLALGGNALQKNGEVTAEAQKKVASEVGELIADLSQKYEIVVAHGNGPQIGNILIHEETAATDQAPAMPLETAVAMSQGQIGYWLTQAIGNAIVARGKRRQVVTVVSQIVVDKNDPAFKNPTKPIGQFYSEKEAKKLAAENGWTVKEDAGRGWRRVVASPRPIDIVEKASIRRLMQEGVIIIAAGGGGIPVYRTKVRHKIKGIDAVIDKDFAAEKLAELVQADIFISLTAVPNVYVDYGTPNQTPLRNITAGNLQKLIQFGYFKPGSMLPKVEAVIQFASRSTKKSPKTGIITDINHLGAALQNKAGTIVVQ